MSLFSTKKLDALRASMTPASALRVLIVDDKEANLSVMAAILRPHFTVVEAHDGQEALGVLAEIDCPEQLACIVTDHRMPRMSGVEFLARARQHYPDAARILVTGYIDVDAAIDAINKAEVQRFLVKPFDADDFLQAVQEAVARFSGQRAALDRLRALESENAELRAQSKR